MGDTRFATLAKPTPKKKAPENGTEEEETSADTDSPTKIDQSEITQTSPENAFNETMNREGAEEEEGAIYQPKPAAKQFSQFDTVSQKEQDGDVDLEQSLEEIVAEVDKTDDEAEPQTTKSRSEYTPIRRRSKDEEGEENHQNRKPGKINFPRQIRKDTANLYRHQAQNA